MTNETPAAIDPEMFAAVFSQNWDNARYIKSERISFMNAYSVICAGVLALLQSVQASDLIRIALLFFMTLFSLIGLLTSLRLKGELEECLAKIEAMSVQARVNDFVALGQLEGRSSRYPRFRWIFPIFYANPAYLGGVIVCAFTCRQDMRRTHWLVIRSPTCRTGRTCFFRMKLFSTRIGRSIKLVRCCERCERSKI